MVRTVKRRIVYDRIIENRFYRLIHKLFGIRGNVICDTYIYICYINFNCKNFNLRIEKNVSNISNFYLFKFKNDYV